MNDVVSAEIVEAIVFFDVVDVKFVFSVVDSDNRLEIVATFNCSYKLTRVLLNDQLVHALIWYMNDGFPEFIGSLGNFIDVSTDLCWLVACLVDVNQVRQTQFILYPIVYNFPLLLELLLLFLLIFDSFVFLTEICVLELAI